MFDKYNRTARLYPAIICSIPVFILNFYVLRSHAGEFLDSLNGVKWIGGATLYVALTYFLAQFGRTIGKELFEKKYFKDELYMPTTNFLLHADNTYSLEHKRKIHEKIYNDFGVKIHSVKEENQEMGSARRAIAEGVSMVRGKVKNGRLLLQHNIEYGFMRNLIGGSLIASFLSVGNILIFTQIFPNHPAFYLSVVTGIIFLSLVIFSRILINNYGNRYAKILIQEYLQLPGTRKRSK